MEATEATATAPTTEADALSIMAAALGAAASSLVGLQEIAPVPRADLHHLRVHRGPGLPPLRRRRPPLVHLRVDPSRPHHQRRHLLGVCGVTMQTDDTTTDAVARKVPRRKDDAGDGYPGDDQCVAEIPGTRCSRSTGHEGLHMGPLTSFFPGGDEFREEWGSEPAAPVPKKRGRRGAIGPSATIGAPPAPDDDLRAPVPAPAIDGRYEPAVALTDILPSPRRAKHLAERFAKTDPEMIELVESVTTHGVIQPIVLRPRPADSKAAQPYELVAGERRWVASDLAGRATIPAIIAPLSDVQVVEVQLLENLRRKQPHELDEAYAYRELLDRHGYTIDALVAKTGQGKGTIYARLKLLDLTAVARKALLERKIVAAVAVMIARLPAELQEQAVQEVLGDADWQAYRDSGVEFGAIAGTRDREEVREPMSVRQAQVHLQRRFMLRLDQARFALDDEHLVPGAGACTVCTFRTGNQPELFADVTRAAAAAKVSGTPVLPAKKSSEIFRPDGTTLYGSSYADPAAQLPHDAWPKDGTPPTWAKMFGSELATVPKVLVQDLSGAPRELIDVAAATKLLHARGKLPKPGKSASPSPKDDEAAKKRALERRREIARRALREIGRAATDQYIEGAGPRSAPWWRFLAARVLELLGTDDRRAICGALKIEPKKGGGSMDGYRKAILEEIAVAGVPGARGLLAMMLAQPAGAGGLWSSGFDKRFTDAAVHWEVDVGKIGKDLDAEAKGKKATRLSDPCSKCGRELGEHDGKKCPKPKTTRKGR